MSEFLLELFSEEIPAKMQEEAQTRIRLDFERAFARIGVKCKLRSYVSATRLVLEATELPEILNLPAEEKKGPSTSAPNSAITGFLNKYSDDSWKIIKRNNDKGDFYFAVKPASSIALQDELKIISEEIIRNFSWPKSMRWGNNEITWIRPLNNILCIFDGRVIPVSYGHLTANNCSFTNKVAGEKKITVYSLVDYHKKLRAGYIIVDREERRELINTQLSEFSLPTIKDEHLMEEVLGLVEWPQLLIGEIDKQFMRLPKELLSLSLKEHQKYFTFADEKGNLLNKFALVTQLEPGKFGDETQIRAGAEKVLRARLHDAAFFYEQDVKHGIENYAKELQDVLFHKQLGTIAEKAERIGKIASEISNRLNGIAGRNIKTAAALCKADLKTAMVGEFPELQGIMGYYYALEAGYSQAVAIAIRDHYKPSGLNDEVPEDGLTIVISIADKIDTLVGLFAAGERPTGSKDPFALRRQAIAIIRLIIANNITLDLHGVINYTASLYAKAIDDLPEEVFQFIVERLKQVLKDRDISHNSVEAITAKAVGSDILTIVKHCEKLEDFICSDRGTSLKEIYKRAANIITKAKENDLGNGIDETLFEGNEEKQLFTTINILKAEVDDSQRKGNFSSGLISLGKLATPMASFFDNIIVNTDDENIRKNRLLLLKAITELFDKLADFSKL